MPRLLKVFFFLLVWAGTETKAYSQDREAARLLLWQPRQNETRDFEEGYKRHLNWHQNASDPWEWYGWTIVTGEHVGWFMDGTFFHPITDLDHPVSPADDAADGNLNVSRYADCRISSLFEIVSSPGMTPKALRAPFLNVIHLDVKVGHERELEKLIFEAFEGVPKSSFEGVPESSYPYVLLRPINGSREYLLLIPSANIAAISEEAHILQALQDRQGDAHLQSYPMMELGRFRNDLSYVPTESRKR